MVASESVGVVGLGYVGLPLALALSGSGYDVVGVDTDQETVSKLRTGGSHIDDVPETAVKDHLDRGMQFSTEYDVLSDVAGVALCVPTPLDKTQQPNLSHVVDATRDLATVLPEDCVVVLESTVYPKATADVVAPIFDEAGYDIGETFHVAYSPERIDPGNDTYSITEIPKVLGGVTDACTVAARALYEPTFDEIVEVESATEAELVKLLENTFRTVNIALINELATVANELGVDIWDTIDAASTKPFGFMPFYPGPGLGGHCLPIDPLYLSWQAGQHGLNVEFIELADKINREMPSYVVDRSVTLLNEHGTPVPEANVLILGVAYKSDVSDTRESPAFDVISLLRDQGATVQYHDPHVPSLEVNSETYESAAPLQDVASTADIAIILTDHEVINFRLIVNCVPVVFDTRHATDGTADNVFML